MNKISTGNNRLILALCSIALVSAVFMQAANALDRKILSGAICQPNSPSQVGDFTYFSTGIQNTSTATRWTTCPALRDNTFNTNGVNFAGVYVAGTGSFFCYLDNVDNDGTLGRWASGSRTNTGYLSTNLATTTSQTPYAFLCSLPAGGKVVTTVIDEY
jgi:hypothetical protein